MGVKFGLLGDVEVRVDGRPVAVGHARQRCVLVVLLAEANHAVSVDQLVDRIWGQRTPHRARETLYNYLSRLRHALAPITEVDLVRKSGGYALIVDPMAVDVHHFGHLVAQARAADDQDRALELFEQALGLWQGMAFAGLDTPWINELRNTLERDRFAVELDCTDLRLRRGEHGWLLSEITTQAAAHPLDERVAGQMMLALYQCGRQAEALNHFQRLRARLVDELGIDPGPELQHLYERILTTDLALAPRGSVLVSAPPVPRQLPAHTPHFVGRAAELHQLTTLLDTATTPSGGTVVITAIDGTAGIGKTALALHWAHHAAERFPDGQLYVNLRGFDPTNAPMHPADALRGLLEALAIPPERIPTSLEGQAGLYRSLLADRHVLVVLDNARDADQVRPLLPASPTCLVVITSRNQLTGLVAREGAHLVTLDVLTPQEARALLAHHLGTDRVGAEPSAVIDLIDSCARLPLALAIAAARAAIHPGFALRVLAKELADEHSRLDALDIGEATTSVKAVFSWSYHHLSLPAARMFRLLGLHPGPDIALPAATQLTDMPPHQAQESLAELTRAHLLTQRTPDRYAFHDLLRVYATHLTTTYDPPDDQHTALTRLFDHYLSTATAAMVMVIPADYQHWHGVPLTAPHPDPPMADLTTARTWLDTEQANLAAIIAHTATHGWYSHTTRLVNTVLLTYIGGRYPGALIIHTHALHAAHHTGDRANEARTLSHLGLVHWQQGRYQQAAEHHQQAFAIYRELGDRSGEAFTLSNLGLLHWQQGRYQQAVEHHQHALAISRELGDRSVEAHALGNLGVVHWRQGHCQQAAEHHQHALAISREIGNRSGEALTLSNLGLVHWQQSRFPQAADHYEQALKIYREIGFPVGEVLPLTYLGLVHWRQGRYQQAVEHHQHSLAISREIGAPVAEAFALGNLGLVHWRQGHYQQAAEHHQHALAIYREIGAPVGEALALTQLGLVHCQQGHYEEAADYHQQALAISRRIGDRSNEAQIRNGLAEAHHANGELDQARTQHSAALTLATETGDRYEQARAHHGLAHTHHTAGDLDRARHHWHQALTHYTELDVPDADDVRAHLTDLNQT
ncbi:MAG: tetratricopeptide repeat protein [Pseudonocardiaceae bacterium]